MCNPTFATLVISFAANMPPDAKPIRLELNKPLRASFTVELGKPPWPTQFGIFEVEATADGPLTISLSSYDLDVMLQIRTADGKVVGFDDDGGIGTNARIVISAHEGERFLIDGAVKDMRSAAFEIVVTSGASGRRDTPEFKLATLDFYRTRAARAHGREDFVTEARSRVMACQYCSELGQFAEAIAEGREACRLARECADELSIGRALYGIARAKSSLGLANDVVTLLDRSWQLVARNGDFLAATNTLLRLGAVLRERGDALGSIRALRCGLALALEGAIEGAAIDFTLDLSRSFSNLKQLKSSERLARQALVMARRSQDLTREFWALDSLGDARRSLSRFDQAFATFEKQVSVATDLRDPGKRARALQQAGQVCVTLGDNHKKTAIAHQEYEAAVEDGSPEKLASAAEGLADWGFNNGDYVTARTWSKHWIAWTRECIPSTETAAPHICLAACFEKEANLRNARRELRKAAVVAAERGSATDRHSVLEALMALETAIGDVRRGARIAARLDELGSPTMNVDDSIRSKILVAGVARMTSRPDDVISILEAQAELAEQLGAKDREIEALSGLGQALFDRGFLREARSHLERAGNLASESGSRLGLLNVRIVLGNVLGSIGEHVQALDSLERGREIAESMSDPREDEETSLCVAAECLNVNDTKGAIDAVRHARAVALETGNERLSLLSLLGACTVYRVVGDRTRAILCAQRAAASAGMFQDMTFEARHLENLAWLAEQRGDYREARQFASASVAGYSRTGWHISEMTPLAILASSALECGEFVECKQSLDQAWETLSGSGVADNDRSLLWVSSWSSLATVAQDLTTELTSCSDRADEGLVANGLLWADRWKGRNLVYGILGRCSYGDRLRLLVPSSPAADDQVATLDSVRRLLGDDGALLEFADGRERVFGYLLTRRELVRFEVGSREELDSDCLLFSEAVLRNRTLNPDVLGTIGSSLYKKIIGAIDDHLGGVKKLIVVPSQSVGALPFDALPTGRKTRNRNGWKRDEYLVDRFEVTTLPSMATGVAVSSLAPRTETNRYLLVGDPVFAAENSGSWRSDDRMRERRLERLVGTREEIAGIVEILTGARTSQTSAALTARSSAFSGERFEARLGSAASLGVFSGDLRQYGVLHLATHARVDPSTSDHSGLALSAKDGVDQWLTIRDVFDLALDADLVVLSSCESAKGVYSPGDGIQSLARAFMYAGSRAVIASLCQVDDATVRQLMLDFYRSVSSGVGYASALRAAKLSLLDADRPSDGAGRGLWTWAAMVYIGLPD
jgi:CHAT domain-containing protein/tetratricopeptide (TPR) repeat protein